MQDAYVLIQLSADPELGPIQGTNAAAGLLWRVL